MVLRCILVEVLEAVEGFLALLYLIKYEECLPRLERYVCKDGKLLQDPLRPLRGAEDGLELRLSVEVKLGVVVKVIGSKGLHHPGLADLPSTLEQDRLPVGGVFPPDKVVTYVSLNGHNTLLSAEKCQKSHFSLVNSAIIAIVGHIA